MKKPFSIFAVVLGVAALVSGLWGVVQKSSQGFMALWQFGMIPPEGIHGFGAFLYRYGLLTVFAGLLLLILGILLWVVGREEEEEEPTHPEIPDRAALKSRVKSLLYKNWGGPLLALLYTLLPALMIGVLIQWLLAPYAMIYQGLKRQAAEIFMEGATAMDQLMMLVLFTPDWMPMLHALPGLLLSLSVGLLVTQPFSVACSAYCLRFLRGKRPRAQEVFQTFAKNYPRALGGMTYRWLWIGIWQVVTYGVPIGMFASALGATYGFAETLGVMGQIYLLGGALVGGLLWMIIFSVVLINRSLAYCMTSCVLASQPKLPAWHALRVSRMLMRGQKWQVIKLYLGFITYYLPAVFAGLLLFVLVLIGQLLTLPSTFMVIASIVCTWVMVLNQLILCYVAPLSTMCFHALYLECKRIALRNETITPAQLGISPHTKESAQVQSTATAQEGVNSL